MQTFLPFESFIHTSLVLDNKRLGKQRVEAYQILLCLQKPNRWKNHPAVRMWEGYEECLKNYITIMIDEWIARGFVNNMERYPLNGYVAKPYWLGDEKFHASHRSNLKRKDPIYYQQFKEPIDLPYIWPTKENYDTII